MSNSMKMEGDNAETMCTGGLYIKGANMQMNESLNSVFLVCPQEILKRVSGKALSPLPTSY